MVCKRSEVKGDEPRRWSKLTAFNDLFWTRKCAFSARIVFPQSTVLLKKNIGYFPRNHKFSFCVGFPCHVKFLYLLGTCNLDELNRLVFCLLSVCRHLCMRLFHFQYMPYFFIYFLFLQEFDLLMLKVIRFLLWNNSRLIFNRMIHPTIFFITVNKR